MKFRCENCNNEYKFGIGVITLICQSCGCPDLRFDTTIMVTPYYPGVESEKNVKSIRVIKDESFFGNHSKGQVWHVDYDRLMEKTDVSENQVKKTSPPVPDETDPVVAALTQSPVQDSVPAKVNSEPEKNEPEKKEAPPVYVRKDKLMLLKPKKRFRKKLADVLLNKSE